MQATKPQCYASAQPCKRARIVRTLESCSPHGAANHDPPEGRLERRLRTLAGSPHGRPRALRQIDPVLLFLSRILPMPLERARRRAGGWGPAASSEARSPDRLGAQTALSCSWDGRCARTTWSRWPAGGVGGGGWRQLVRGKPADAAGVSGMVRRLDLHSLGMETFSGRARKEHTIKEKGYKSRPGAYGLPKGWRSTVSFFFKSILIIDLACRQQSHSVMRLRSRTSELA